MQVDRCLLLVKRGWTFTSDEQRATSDVFKMAVVIRLSRHGTKKKPYYRVVAADENFPRDGRFLEMLGTYNPKHPEGKGNMNKERIAFWVSRGAKPSSLVSQILKRSA